MKERPKTAAMFLQWLLPRQESLAKLVQADLRSRALTSQAAKAASETLASRLDCISRHVDYILLKKGLFLYYNCMEHPHIASISSFEALVAKACEIILTTRVDDHFLEMVGVTRVKACDIA